LKRESIPISTDAAVVERKPQRKIVNRLTGVVSAVIPKEHVSSGPPPVNQSLSSAFFRNLHKEGIDEVIVLSTAIVNIIYITSNDCTM